MVNELKECSGVQYCLLYTLLMPLNSSRLEWIGLIAHALDILYKTGCSAVNCPSIHDIFGAIYNTRGNVYVYKYCPSKKGNLKLFQQNLSASLVDLHGFWADIRIKSGRNSSPRRGVLYHFLLLEGLRSLTWVGIINGIARGCRSHSRAHETADKCWAS